MLIYVQFIIIYIDYYNEKHSPFKFLPPFSPHLHLQGIVLPQQYISQHFINIDGRNRLHSQFPSSSKNK